MDKHRIDGAALQIRGSLKEAIGKVNGDRRIEREGAAEKSRGMAQRAARERTERSRRGARTR